MSKRFGAEPVDDVQRHITEQRAADRLLAAAVWVLHPGSQLGHSEASRPRGDDVVIELPVPNGARRVLVASHPDVPACQAAAVVVSDPAPPSSVLPV